MASRITKDISHKPQGVSFGDTFFKTYAYLFDQSLGAFENKEKRRNVIFYLSFACINMVFCFLNHLYKRDNIARLTLDPPLIPFDTFKNLVQNHFQILARRYNLAYSVPVM